MPRKVFAWGERDTISQFGFFAVVQHSTSVLDRSEKLLMTQLQNVLRLRGQNVSMSPNVSRQIGYAS